VGRGVDYVGRIRRIEGDWALVDTLYHSRRCSALRPAPFYWLCVSALRWDGVRSRIEAEARYRAAEAQGLQVDAPVCEYEGSYTPNLKGARPKQLSVGARCVSRTPNGGCGVVTEVIGRYCYFERWSDGSGAPPGPFVCLVEELLLAPEA
jgi:hypothetical protein